MDNNRLGGNSMSIEFSRCKWGITYMKKRLFSLVIVSLFVWQCGFSLHWKQAKADVRFVIPGDLTETWSVEQMQTYQKDALRWFSFEELTEEQHKQVVALFWGDTGKATTEEYIQLREYFEEVSRLRPDDSIALMGVGLLNGRLGAYEIAIRKYSDVLDGVNRSNTKPVITRELPDAAKLICLYRKGELLWKLEDYYGAQLSFIALDEMKTAENDFFSDIRIQYYIAMGYAQYFRYPHAAAICKEILNDESWFENEDLSELGIYDLLALFACSLYDMEEVVAKYPMLSELNALIREDPNHFAARTARAHMLFCAGALELARKEFAANAEFAVSLLPSLTDLEIKEDWRRAWITAMGFCAYIDLTLGQPKLGIQALEDILFNCEDLSSHNQISVMNALATIYSEMKDTGKAEVFLKQILESRDFMDSTDDEIKQMYQNAVSMMIKIQEEEFWGEKE